MNARDENRDAQMVVMRASGETLDAIGSAFGVSRERARQVLARNGGTGSRPAAVDPLAVMRLIRQRETVSLAPIADVLGVDVSAVYRFLHELGRASAVRRLLRWRQRSAMRVSLTAQLRTFATVHGRTPYMRELGLKPGTPRHADLPGGGTLQQAFGSVTAAFVAAGLELRRTWKRGSAQQTHCKRDHPLSGDNVYVHRLRTGTTARACKACKRLRSAARRKAREGCAHA